MKLSLLFALILATAAPSYAATPRCNLDVSNPAITRTPIPLHEPNQGVTVYNDPSEWVPLTNQEQWEASNDDMMRHVHLEFCFPIRAEITGPITIPFRLRTFMQGGAMAWALNGYMVRDVVFETATAPFLGNINGESVATGHLTLDPFIIAENDTTNIRRAAINGWTNFEIGYLYRQLNGDVLGNRAFLSAFTKLDPSFPEQTQFGPEYGPYNDLNVLGEAGGGANWGVSTIVLDGKLPGALAPINTFWPLPGLHGASYAGNSALLDGVTQIYWDRDLHHGIEGTLQARTDGIDPSGHSAGVHNVSILWTTTSGPNGVPGVAFPNETLTTVFGWPLTVGDGSTQTLEICGNGIDDNGDGQIDEGCAVTPPPPVDVCPNIAGNQATVPVGMQLVNGQCVATPPPPDWQAITGVLQRLNDAIRLMLPDGKVVILPNAITP